MDPQAGPNGEPGQWYDVICNGQFQSDGPIFVPYTAAAPGPVVQPQQLAQEALASRLGPEPGQPKRSNDNPLTRLFACACPANLLPSDVTPQNGDAARETNRDWNNQPVEDNQTS
jgi:uncharacterized protein YbjT (DUF2867 family)